MTIAKNELELLFSEAVRDWNLEKLYPELDTIKLKSDQQHLTILEKACLRGLLCGYHPQEIGEKLELEPKDVVFKTICNLCSYLEVILAPSQQSTTKYWDVAQKLAAAGYKKIAIKEQSSLESTTSEIIDDPSHLELINLENTHNKIINSNPNSELKFEFITQQNSINIPLDFKLNSTQSNLADKNVALNLNIDRPAQCFVQEEKVANNDIIATEPQSQQIALALSPDNSVSIVESDDFLPPISNWSKWGGLLLVSSVIGAIALAAFTPYNFIVKANATIRPDGKNKVVQAETSGTIVSINAKENQIIKQGDIIANIDNSALETEKNLLQNQIQQAQLQLQQIQAQTSALNHQIFAETNRIQYAVAEATIKLSGTLRNYRNEQITTTAQVEEALANLNLAKAELQQAEAELKSASAILASQTAALKSARSKQERYQTIAESGALSQDRLEETNLAVQQQQQQVIAQQATVVKHQSAISRQKEAIAGAKARLDNMSAALNPSDSEIAIDQKGITQVKARGEATLANLRREQETLKQQTIDTQKQLERYQRQLQQKIKESDRHTIKASASGTLFKLNLRNLGQNIKYGS